MIITLRDGAALFELEHDLIRSLSRVVCEDNQKRHNLECIKKQYMRKGRCIRGSMPAREFHAIRPGMLIQCHHGALQKPGCSEHRVNNIALVFI